MLKNGGFFMLDIRLIREDKDKVIELVAKKGNDVSIQAFLFCALH